MSVRPPLPPRRSLPPPPPPRRGEKKGVDEEGIPVGIAARIASLQLSQIRRSPPPILPPRKGATDLDYGLDDREPVDNDSYELNSDDQQGPPPPLVPPRWTRPSPADLARALARRPPPPPAKESPGNPSNTNTPASSVIPDPPRRRLPPMPSRLPTPPPEPEHGPQEVLYEAEQAPYYDPDTSCLKCRDFSHVDSHAALFPRHTVTSLDNLAYDLTESFPYETEKARAIFTWLHYNIAYDAESFFSGNIQHATAESTLNSGLAVCDGYAGLFKSLGDRIGLQIHRVTGHGKGIGYTATGDGEPVPPLTSNHAWNCILMDGEWHLIDSCWGAGVLNGGTYDQRFDPSWFTSTPTEFGRRHFPTDPSFQLIPEEEGGSISWEDYILEPEGPIIYRDFYQLDLLPTLLQPSTKCIRGEQRISFQVFKRCEHMSTAELDNLVYILTLADNTRVPLELNPEGGWSANVYIPKGGEVSLASVTTVDGKDATGLGVKGFNKALGRKGMSFGGLAKWMVI